MTDWTEDKFKAKEGSLNDYYIIFKAALFFVIKSQLNNKEALLHDLNLTKSKNEIEKILKDNLLYEEYLFELNKISSKH